MRFAPHLRDIPKMRASSRSTSEGSSSPRMAANSRARKSTARAGPSSTSPADRMRLSSRYARHLVAEHLVDACPLLTARQVWYEMPY